MEESNRVFHSRVSYAFTSREGGEMTLTKARRAFDKFTDALPEKHYIELEYWIDEIEEYLERLEA